MFSQLTRSLKTNCILYNDELLSSLPISTHFDKQYTYVDMILRIQRKPFETEIILSDSKQNIDLKFLQDSSLKENLNAKFYKESFLEYRF